MLCKPFGCRGNTDDVVVANKQKTDRTTETSRSAPPALQTNGDTLSPRAASSPRPSSMRASSVMSRDDSAIFHDAMEGTDAEWEGLMYPPIISASVPRASAVAFTLDEPETLLRTVDEESSLVMTASRLTSQHSKRVEAGQFKRARRSTRALSRELEKPGVVVKENGFPGQLSPEELEQVQLFRKELDERDPVYREIVHALEPIEEEAYALCRFLRARKFVPADVFALMDEAKDIWREAKAKDFYPDKEAALKCDTSLFSMQYPFMYYGNAKNGCPVCYFNIGQIQSEGILCLTTLASVPGYFWHEYMYTLKAKLAAGREANPNFVRCETVQVYDLKGLSRSTINSDAIEVVKIAAEITKCFPETLHCLIILNAPSFFKFAWALIKKFIDARTASRIEVYSNSKQGTKRVLELIDTAQLPSDYGGTAPPTSTIIDQNDDKGGNGAQKKVVELLYVRKGGKETKYEFQIKKGNKLSSAKIYTRSATGGMFTLYKDDKVIGEVEVAPETPTPASDTASDAYTAPYWKELAVSNAGPGKYRIVGSSKLAPGYFLFVAEMQKS